MLQCVVNLNFIDSVKEFVNVVTQFDTDMELGSGRYVIDAKSIMGIFSLDLSKDIVLTIHAEAEDCTELLDAIDKFVVREGK